MATREQLIEDFADHKLATGEKFERLINSMKVVQEPVTDPAASGASLSFIDSISQDADGKITATKKTLDLANAHELNPFKGWYKTGDTLPTDGFDGAYLYFKDTSELTGQTTIYRWNGTAYADTGTVVDTSNVQTFETGQALSGVAIKGLNGQNDPSAMGVLSAEQGMMMGQKLRGVTLTETKATWETITGKRVDGTTGNLLTNQYFDVAIIDVQGYDYVRFSGAEINGNATGDNRKTGYAFGYFDNENWVPVAFKTFTFNTGTAYTFKEYIEKVPKNATHMYTCCKVSNVVTASKFYCYLESGKTIKEEIDSIEINEVETILGNGPNNSKGYIYVGSTANQKGKQLTSNSNYVSGYIYVEGAKRIEFNTVTQISVDTAGWAFYTSNKSGNAYDAADCIAAYAPDVTVAATTKPYTLDVPANAKYFRMTIAARALGSSAAYRFNGIKVIRDEENAYKYQPVHQFNRVTSRCFFYDGNIDVNGKLLNDSTKVMSGIIEAGRGFFVRVFDEYEVHSAHLVTLGGDLVHYGYKQPKEITSGHLNETMQIYSSEGIPAQFGIVIVVSRVDGQKIKKDDVIVKEFCYTDDKVKYVRETGDGYDAIHYRLNQLMKLYWTPLHVFSGGSVTGNVYQWFTPTKTRNGIAYSDNLATSMYVGPVISPRTYLSALKNPLSVMYTESLSNNSSHYGYDYSMVDTSMASRFYGLSCFPLINYLWGWDFPLRYTDISLVEGMSSLLTINKFSEDAYSDEDWFEHVQLFDAILDPVHVTVITDIISVDGVRKYIVLSEQTWPTGYVIVYDKESFNQRYNTYLKSTDEGGKGWSKTQLSFISYSGLATVPMPMLTLYIQQNEQDYEIPLEMSEDICTQLGDYVAVTKDDILWLNVKRANRYTSVKIKKNDAVVETINISSLAQDTLFNDTQDWVSVDITDRLNNMSAGLYEAVAVDGNGIESAPTHFEVVEIEMTLTNLGINQSTGNGTFNATVITTGIPVLIQAESSQGSPHQRSVIIVGNNYTTEGEEKTASVSGDYFTTNKKFIKAISKGIYGSVVKRIDITTI